MPQVRYRSAYLQVEPLDADVTPDYLLPLERRIPTVTAAS